MDDASMPAHHIPQKVFHPKPKYQLRMPVYLDKGYLVRLDCPELFDDLEEARKQAESWANEIWANLEIWSTGEDFRLIETIEP